MQNTDSDKFETEHKNPFNKEIKVEDNFFLANEAPGFTKVSEPSRRLNDYDFNLLKEDAYKEVDDDLFKLEYRISKTEEEIKDTESQIQLAKDIRDFNLVENLEAKKRVLQEDYEALAAIYNQKSLSAKITDILGGKLKTGFSLLQKQCTAITDKVLMKLPKRFSSIVEIKKSLEKLENLNKSVDELMTFNVPYGENLDKYEQLSKYIIKANSIQKEIAKHIK